MFTSSVLAALALCAGVAISQTPEGFEPSTDTTLGVAFGDLTVTPGRKMTKEGQLSHPLTEL